jgi:hypothetical protein
MCFTLNPLLLFDVRFWNILSFLMGRLQKVEALKVRVTKASEVSEREKVMCFHGNPFFLSCTSEILVDQKRFYMQHLDYSFWNLAFLIDNLGSL